MVPEWLDLATRIAGIVGGVLGFLGGAVLWMARNTLATKAELHSSFEAHGEEHDELNRRLEEGESKFAAILADLEHLPGHSDLNDIRDRIAAVEGEVKALAATIDGLKEVLERVERPLNILVEHHMNGGRR